MKIPDASFLSMIWLTIGTFGSKIAGTAMTSSKNGGYLDRLPQLYR